MYDAVRTRTDTDTCLHFSVTLPRMASSPTWPAVDASFADKPARLAGVRPSPTDQPLLYDVPGASQATAIEEEGKEAPPPGADRGAIAWPPTRCCRSTTGRDRVEGRGRGGERGGSEVRLEWCLVRCSGGGGGVVSGRWWWQPSSAGWRGKRHGKKKKK